MSYEDKLAREGQLLVEHIKGVEGELRKEKRYSKDLKYLGFLHDIAKFSNRFQEKLKSKKDNKFRHPVAAIPIADYVLRDDPEPVRLIKLLVIYYHHSPISFDMLQDDIIKTSKTSIDNEILSEYTLTKDEIIDAFECLSSFSLNAQYQDFLKHIKCQDEKNLEKDYIAHINQVLRNFYERLEEIDVEFKSNFADAYSALVTADWKNSGNVESDINWESLLNKFETAFKYEPNEVQNKVWNEVDSTNKLFLVAPTGSGKSEASLKWALMKAQKTGKKRIIYVLPFNSLIKDLYGRFVEYFGEENVDVWNSDYLFVGLNKLEYPSFEAFNFNIIMRKYFMEKPIIITTADQILMSYLNLERYPIRLGLFKESVFVFDEIQGYGALMRGLIYEFINDACKEDDSAVLVMTATPPREIKSEPFHDFTIIENDDWIRKFHDKYNVEINIKFLGSTEEKDEDENKREKLSKEILNITAEFIEKNPHIKRMAVVVNTINDAVNLYKKIKSDKVIKSHFGESNIVLLHSTMMAKDKGERLNKIINNQNVLAITTQVIEAGVDTNFEACIRMIAPFESLVQTLGRVNRCGKNRDGLKTAKFVIIGINNARAFLPYDTEEVNMVQDILNQNRERIKTRIEFEKLIDEVQIDSNEFKDISDYIHYISSRINRNIWSVNSIEEVLGSSLRENIKNTVFVKTNENKESFENKINEIRKDLQTNFNQTKLEEYINLLKEYKGSYITSWERGEVIEFDNYRKKYLGE